MSRTYGKNEWREDLKTLLKKTSTPELFMVFLFIESQVTNLKVTLQMLPINYEDVIVDMFRPLLVFQNSKKKNKKSLFVCFCRSKKKVSLKMLTIC